MSEALNALADLKAAYAAATSPEEYAALWDIVNRLEAALTSSTKKDKQELQALDGLKRVVSEAIRNSREGLNQPTNLGTKVSALETTIKRSTIGPDGWPMAKR